MSDSELVEFLSIPEINPEIYVVLDRIRLSYWGDGADEPIIVVVESKA